MGKTATVTSKGQITIPRDVRDALGLLPGTQVEFEIEHGKAVLRKRVSEEAFRRWQGYLAGKFPTGSVDTLMEELRGERLLDEEQHPNGSRQ